MTSKGREARLARGPGLAIADAVGTGAGAVVGGRYSCSWELLQGEEGYAGEAEKPEDPVYDDHEAEGYRKLWWGFTEKPPGDRLPMSEEPIPRWLVALN